MSKGLFFWRDEIFPMIEEENSNESVNLLNKQEEIVHKVAAELSVDAAEFAPFLEEWVAKMQDREVPGMAEDDLVSIGTELMQQIQAGPETTNEEETDAEDLEPIAEVELVEPQEVVQDDEEPEEEGQSQSDEELAAIVLNFLQDNPCSKRVIEKTHGFDKERLAKIVDELVGAGLIRKVKKTLHLNIGNPEVDEADEAEINNEVPDDEPDYIGLSSENVMDNGEYQAITHALNVKFDGIQQFVIESLEKAKQASSENNAYKAQAEQYTDVMNSLRELLDEIQTSEQYKLHDPLWQRVARIAEWQPEA